MGKVYKAKANFEVPLSKIMASAMSKAKRINILRAEIATRREYLDALNKITDPVLDGWKAAKIAQGETFIAAREAALKELE